MATVINIFIIKINSIASNASLNIGESLIHSPSATAKYTGSNTSYGDESPSIAAMKNTYIDPDVNDMNDIGGGSETLKVIQS